MDVFIVWRGHRDYEEDVAACETRERVEKVLADHGVRLRPDPAPQVNEESLLDDDFVPWGILEVPFLGAFDG